MGSGVVVVVVLCVVETVDVELVWLLVAGTSGDNTGHGVTSH